MSQNPTTTLHVEVSITVNGNSTWAYEDPRVEKRVSFSVPLELFHSPAFTKMVDKRIEELAKEYAEKLKSLEE